MEISPKISESYTAPTQEHVRQELEQSFPSDSSNQDEKTTQKIRHKRNESYSVQIANDEYDTIPKRRLFEDEDDDDDNEMNLFGDEDDDDDNHDDDNEMNSSRHELQVIKCWNCDEKHGKEKHEKVDAEKILEDAEEIIGARRDLPCDMGGLNFLVRSKENEAAFVSNFETNEKVPLLVIAFYEKRLNWDGVDPVVNP